VNDDETSSVVTNRATERALERSEDCLFKAMLSNAKLFYINCGLRAERIAKCGTKAADTRVVACSPPEKSFSSSDFV
jgi:hypothetical protein